MKTTRFLNISPTSPVITLSIISHGQGELIKNLLVDILQCSYYPFEIILTLNIPEDESFITSYCSPLKVKVIRNIVPRGFGFNHNSAFKISSGKYFCVLNPDIRFKSNPFTHLTSYLISRHIGVIAPKIITSNGVIEDSVRRFPTPFNMLLRVFRLNDSRFPDSFKEKVYPVDWVAGMFMFFTREDYNLVGGFDDKYYLYCEDIDICVRLWNAGRRVAYCSDVTVIHDAQRTSKKELKYMIWHINSLLRFFAKHWLRLPNTVNQSDT
jgi:N-acetylglucosaminyl-diphospho-decaprenol L-rhamnosyltransferase